MGASLGGAPLGVSERSYLDVDGLRALRRPGVTLGVRPAVSLASFSPILYR